MVTRTWIGGGNNSVDNPKDWSPSGLPASGDGLLSMTNGVMNIDGYHLPSGDYVGISGSVTLKLLDSASFAAEVYAGSPKIEMHDTDTLLVGSNYMASTIVDLAAHSNWVGNFFVAYNSASITVNGSSSATFINTAIAGAINPGPSGGNGRETINVAVAGTGAFDVLPLGTLTFTKAVGAGQTVDISSSILILDDPKRFAGTVNLASGEIDLNSLAKADGYTFRNDILSIYADNRVIDTLRLNASAVDVHKSGGSVIVYSPGIAPTDIANVLPLHI
jgi:hypothetical protein